MSFWGKHFGSLPSRILEAARTGDLEELKVLLKRRDVKYLSDSEGVTPLDLASMNGHTEVVELLLANGASCDGSRTHSTTDNRPPLSIAALNGHKEVVKLLLANRARVDYRDSEGRTALHEVAASGDKELAELLLSNKADVNAEDRKGMTPLCYAEAKGHNDLAELLRLHGGRVPSRIQKVMMPTSPIQLKFLSVVARAAELLARGSSLVEGMKSKYHVVRLEIDIPRTLQDRNEQATDALTRTLMPLYSTKKTHFSGCSSWDRWTFETGDIFGEEVVERVSEVVEFVLQSLHDTGFLADATVIWVDCARECGENGGKQEVSRTRIWP
jgi:hypothetical protein